MLFEEALYNLLYRSVIIRPTYYFLHSMEPGNKHQETLSFQQPHPFDATMMRSESLSGKQAAALIDHVSQTVKTIMSEKPFDPSHDFHHIERLLRLTRILTASESGLHPETPLDPLLITLTAILHDVGDFKYVLHPTENGGVKVPAPTAESILLTHRAPADLASTV